jgi:ribosomal protein S6E (S10)
MGWETRRGRQYYYRKKWVRGRVVSEYIGGGDIAQFVAMMAEPKARSVKPVNEFAELDQAIQTTQKQIDILLAATYKASGYHQHKGQWRKKRTPKQ